ncbi:Superoxide dismutase [Mn] [Chromobacterium violaceum]|uniref:superoxide dismutase n=1 Tax=Chromobacterium violaceum TaxID=536 RepID=A0A3S4HFM1_CHRVL|nr:Superoxide dismutase [Mn] [Chromobacterium violaceum]
MRDRPRRAAPLTPLGDRHARPERRTLPPRLPAFRRGSLAALALPGLPGAAHASSAQVLPPLPYADNALEPVISARTIGFHYDKHHKAYLDNLNKLIAGRDYADLPLEDILTRSFGPPAMPPCSTTPPNCGTTLSTGAACGRKAAVSRLKG